MQINATLVKGKARVQFGANKVSEESPEVSFQNWETVNVELALDDVMCDHSDSAQTQRLRSPAHSGGLV